MKSNVKVDNVEKVPEYPKLMVGSTGVIVLFTAPRRGTCVGYLKGYEIWNPLGHYTAGWANTGWTDFTGTVELSN